VNGVYLSDIQIWSVVKATPGVRPGIGVTDRGGASVKQHREKNYRQSGSKRAHRFYSDMNFVPTASKPRGAGSPDGTLPLRHRIDAHQVFSDGYRWKLMMVKHCQRWWAIASCYSPVSL
jgi:hypothetical protein